MTTQTMETLIQSLAQRSRSASQQLASASPAAINKALRATAELLLTHKDALQKANKKDLAAARKKGLSAAMLDRLTLSDKAIGSMIAGLKQLISLKSSLGEHYDERTRPNGLYIYKVKVPIGVVGIIYESRPNVTIDAAAICLKSKNAVILRGGSEAYHSNVKLAQLLSQALASVGLPADAVQLIPTTDREAISHLLRQTRYVDLIIPRGGESLIHRVVEESQIPVIKHYKGICHIFVSRHAAIDRALPIVINAKTQRPGTCNAMETLLIDRKLSPASQQALIDTLLEHGVQLFGDAHIQTLSGAVQSASEADWEAEYLDLRLAVKTVDGVQEAIEHINRYSSNHTEAILSENKKEISHFLNEVDSASLIVNASTRFSDGGEYGMGCEIGISTDKLHARGPMGIDDLTTYKWIVEGSGQIRG